ncbi:glycosyltransferase [Helicobacter saguini]|uniref:Glycosyltransferase n=2 Tax=Helicobacter saguini TaxID=1548018 RepID=A0A347VR96_9HELI|nr:glycosyltransferase family 2 protein [Helicobacter saguini]MWV62984.1 glycosyltransferase [Helicobacter saguini]MWV66347.1 glycosyltransferase [Helicobacter saguini]MWV68699.1 glycosyltransferase [Helicobacter saguini]MWV71750.1 glycosyltransferase [Helicobacter saguini]TLD91620.1 glycosyltransferase [Helicobacter saguini]
MADSKNNAKISIVVPCYNEEVSLPKFLDEITKTMSGLGSKVRGYFGLDSKKPFYELIFVNDGSRDRTLELLKDMKKSCENNDIKGFLFRELDSKIDSKKSQDSKENIESKSQDSINQAKDSKENTESNPQDSKIDSKNSKDFTIRIFSFSRNFGKEAAILAGLKQAKGEGVILLDADLQDPPNLIPQMINIWLDSNRDTKVIYARRTTRAGESKLRAFLSEQFYRVSNALSEVKIESGVRDFRLMDREVINSLLNMSEYHRFSKAMFAWVGFKRQCLEYEYIPHFKEASSWSFWKLFKYAIEGIVSFSTTPLRFAFIFGFMISLISLCYGLYRFIYTLLYGNLVPGYPSLIVLITFIGGIQLILLGVIGEYIARIYEQVKNRPIYILESLE